LEVAAILDAPRTEKGRSKPAVGEDSFCDRLCDGSLSRSSEPIEPEDGRLAEILGPVLDFVQYALSCSPQTTGPVPVFISSAEGAMTAIQYQCVSFKIHKFIVFIARLKEPDLDPV